ncbi:MAG TPA: ParA family protein, partial [Longimicrobiaceae bacterium]|nr:ParA family protein [Longimicrobiaceae bacterium]
LTAGHGRSYFEVKPASVNGEAALSGVIESVGRRGFDLVIVDTAAGLTDYAAEALRVCDYVLIPQQAEPLGIRSIPQILHAIQELRKQGRRLQVAGIVLTMVQSDQPESVEVARELRKIIPAQLLLESVVPRDPTFLRASGVGVPLGLLFKKPPAAALVFDQMAAELERKLKLDTAEEANEFTRLMD